MLEGTYWQVKKYMSGERDWLPQMTRIDDKHGRSEDREE